MKNGLAFDASAWAPTDVGKLPTVWGPEMAETVHNAAQSFKGTPSLHTFPAIMQMVMAPTVAKKDVGVMTAPGNEEQSPAGSAEVRPIQR